MVRELRDSLGKSYDPPLYINDKNELCDAAGTPWEMSMHWTTRAVIRAWAWLGKLRRKPRGA